MWSLSLYFFDYYNVNYRPEPDQNTQILSRKNLFFRQPIHIILEWRANALETGKLSGKTRKFSTLVQALVQMLQPEGYQTKFRHRKAVVGIFQVFAEIKFFQKYTNNVRKSNLLVISFKILFSIKTMKLSFYTFKAYTIYNSVL